MHKIFVTEALVLGKRGVGEANTSVALFTKELGLLRASARSARFEKSKLRYGLEPLTAARFSLVRGRSEWRLVGVEEVSRSLVHAEPARRIGKVARLLLQLIHGEEPMPAVFNLVTEGFAALATVEEKEAEHVECVLVLRVLSSLGYVADTTELAPLMLGDMHSPTVVAHAAHARAKVLRTINESLRATGL